MSQTDHVRNGHSRPDRASSKSGNVPYAQTMLLADRGYDADWMRELACQQGAWANIPPRNRKDLVCFSPRSQLSGVRQTRINSNLATR
jgi:transposase